MRQITAVPEASAVACRAGWPAPDPGEDSKSILAELGFGSAQIEVLVKSGVVSGRVPLFPQSNA
jgi:crotonobetainyl-CoA:carnitine CoA-transferase CaiB-like acyl-CoA transferase